MDTNDSIGFPAEGEEPIRAVTLKPFRIDAYAVSNARFATFIETTGHVTDAERCGWSFVFGGLLADDFEPTRGATQAPWWRQVFGANWRLPEGPRDNPTGPPSGQVKVMRSGSYLCHDSYRNRYRVAAKCSNTLGSSTGNTGFRCARDA